MPGAWPYSAETDLVRVRSRIAGSSTFGGIPVQVVAVSALVPPLATAAMVLALPIRASAALVGGYGSESRGPRLDVGRYDTSRP